jgi:transposase
MNKDKKIFGVDISKDFFDVVDQSGKHDQFDNDAQGFSNFKKTLPASALVVMEATGYYHFLLAQYLSANGIDCAVVNPLSVKRFIQMKLAKVKTDKADAKAICEYAMANEVSIYNPLDSVQSECLQLFRLIHNFKKQLTAVKNKLHGEEVLGRPSKTVYHSLNRTKKHLEKELNQLEKKVLELVKKEHQHQITLLKSIPGLGIKTILFLIVVTDGFTKFENASQLCSYAGITPTERSSGSSVRGKSRISKVGNKRLRNLLFMCSFTACKHNKACKEQYERIVNKGKSKKLALLAVSNKLLRQAFAIASSGISYDAKHRSVLAVK